MSYMISFVRCEPGMTASQTLEWLNATWDGYPAEPALALSEDQISAWRLVVERARAQFGPAEEESFDGHVELAWAEPRVRLEYAGSSASIVIPYWYSGDAAEAAVEHAYGVGRIVEACTGLVAVDAQTGGGLALNEVRRAVQAYVETSGGASRLHERE